MSFLSDIGVGGLIGYGIAASLGPAGVAATGSTLALGTLAGVSIGAQVAGAKLSKEQADISQRIAATKSAVAGLAAKRERAQITRQKLQAQARIEGSAAPTGTTGSSIITGSVASGESVARGATGFSLVSESAGRDIFRLGSRSLALEKKKGTADLIGGVSRTLFDVGVQGKRGLL